MTGQSAVDKLLSHVDESDLRRDSTLQSLNELAPILAHLVKESDEVDVIAGLGSGNGAFISALASLLEATEVHAVDKNRDVLKTASNAGLETHRVDLECGSVPLEDDSIDLVVSLGLLEHLTWYDNIIEETRRLTGQNGFLLFSMPNMAGWTNRLSIITGHQPRNVEFSNKRAFGIMDVYGTDDIVKHVHAPTVNAFRNFLQHHGFEVIDTVGLHPYQNRRFVAFIDHLASWRPSLCRRFAMLGKPHTESRSS